MKEDYPDVCPNCQADLEGEDVYEYFLQQYRDEKKALEAAEMYGWTKENPKSFSRIIGLYSDSLDRTIAFMCPDCQHKMERKRK